MWKKKCKNFTAGGITDLKMLNQLINLLINVIQI